MKALTLLYRLEPRINRDLGPEALTSLLRRLSREHRLRPASLLSILREETHNGTATLVPGNASDHGQLHGLGQRAKGLAASLEAAMGIGQLTKCTLVPFSSVVANNGQGVLNTRRRWCVDCADEQIRENGPFYYPLLWTVRGANVCLRHNRLLSNVCRHCGQQQRFLPHQTELYVCDRCNHPLLKNAQEAPRKPTAVETWMTAQVRTVITSPEYGNTLLPAESVTRFLSAVAKLNDVPMKHVGSLLGLDHNTVSQWSYGRYKPSLDLLLGLLYNAQVPLNLMIHEPYAAARQARIHQQSACLPEKKRRNAPWVKRNHDEIRQRVRSIMSEFPKATLKEIARNIGIPEGSVYYIASDIIRSANAFTRPR